MPPSASLAPSPFGNDDWPKQATDAVVKVVDSVRDKTTGPAVNAAHAAKYGIVAAIIALPLSVVLLVGLMRGTEALLQVIGTWQGWSFLADPIWIVYLLYGALFTLFGLICWRKANKPLAAASGR